MKDTVWNNPQMRADEFAKQVDAGRHDHECEQQERSWLCNCAKRRRLAAGPTELPTEDLYFPPPDCPVCAGDLEFDGDGFTCPKCHLAWNSSGTASSVHFTDEYGTNFGGEQFGRLMRDVLREGVKAS